MISSISNNCMPHVPRPNPATLATKLFSALDTKNQGYIEKSDLQTGLANAAPAAASDGTSSTKRPSAEAIFKRLDGNGDGRVTEQEMSDSIQKLADHLQARFRVGQGGGDGGQPPSGPPPADGGGGPRGQKPAEDSGQSPAHDGLAVMNQIMALVHYYGSIQNTESASGETLSTTA